MTERIITINGCNTCPYGMYLDDFNYSVCMHNCCEHVDDDNTCEFPIVEEIKKGEYYKGCPLKESTNSYFSTAISELHDALKRTLNWQGATLGMVEPDIAAQFDADIKTLAKYNKQLVKNIIL